MITTTHNEKEAHYYDSIYAQGYATRNYYPLYLQVLRIVELDRQQHSILEIGCGIGDLAKMIIEHRHHYRGFDFSPVAVECSRTLCPQGNFGIGDAYAPENYLPHDYDTAVALEVLEHVDDLRVIENIPVGVRLIASVPDYDDVAHLRLYKDPRRDILERFQPILHISDIIALTGKGTTGEAKTMYVFQGVRIAFAEQTRKVTPAVAINPKDANTPSISATANIGRNDPCPCGSGKKYKKCCLA